MDSMEHSAEDLLSIVESRGVPSRDWSVPYGNTSRLGQSGISGGAGTPSFLGSGGITPVSILMTAPEKAPLADTDAQRQLLPGEIVIVPDETGNMQQIGLHDPAMETVLRETSKHLLSIGVVNIVVAGQTGVGKSSLINGVFGEEFARTAAGRPVTQQAEWFTSDKVPLRVLDTKGLEAKDYTATVEDLRAEIEHARKAKDPKDQLHIGWVCIAAPSSRIQDCEIDIIRVLNRYNIPVIVALTKYDDDEEFLEIVDQVLTERRVERHAIIGVRAVAKKNRPATGLTEIVMATFRALPSAHRVLSTPSSQRSPRTPLPAGERDGWTFGDGFQTPCQP